VTKAIKILVIDDEAAIRDTLKFILEAYGYQVATASNGREGLETFEMVRPDLVITDLLMPEKDGLETISDLRRQQPGLPIVAISGGGRLGDMGYLKVAESFGAHRVVNKPFEPKDIIDAVQELTRGAS
jgi:CheY-like chemotaxis protein